MTDAQTMDLVRRHIAWGVRPGARVVMCDDIAAAGADVDQVDEFIVARGGRRCCAADGDTAPTGPHWPLPGEVFHRRGLAR